MAPLRAVAGTVAGRAEMRIVVQRVWDDWANLGQLEVGGPQGHVEFLALRLYDCETQQWRMYFANGADGRLDPPMIGTFADGVGRVTA